ncbi:hypothetical protein ACUXDX_001681 [Staphylococcus epidermidis]
MKQVLISYKMQSELDNANQKLGNLKMLQKT